jgi:hypothetical protein
MSTKKTIQINPELFKVPGGKTKKNRAKKELAINPVINPNNLKNKLLKRIKEHKNKELKGGLNTSTNASLSETSNSTYSDEFYGAINYLSDLSKKKKQEKVLHNKTLKKPITPPVTTGTSSQTQVNPQILLELPPELAETSLTPQIDELYNVNYKLTDDIPYGCLKNGKKKTYREWKELTNPSTSFDLPNMIRPPTPPKQNLLVATAATTTSLREEKLEQIKDKLRRIQEQETISKNNTLEELGIIEKNLRKEKTVPLDDLPDFNDTQKDLPDITGLLKQRQDREERENPKVYTKKTVKRKLTLGKSDKLRRVAILIKNRDTRKKIIETHQKLKKTHITDVKKHLNRQGLIKIGSTCPPDIQRKIFESSMLAGDITNTNKEILLHNFLHSDKTV